MREARMAKARKRRRRKAASIISDQGLPKAEAAADYKQGIKHMEPIPNPLISSVFPDELKKDVDYSDITINLLEHIPDVESYTVQFNYNDGNKIKYCSANDKEGKGEGSGEVLNPVPRPFSEAHVKLVKEKTADWRLG